MAELTPNITRENIGSLNLYILSFGSVDNGDTYGAVTGTSFNGIVFSMGVHVDTKQGAIATSWNSAGTLTLYTTTNSAAAKVLVMTKSM